MNRPAGANFLDLFSKPKPVMGMVHLTGSSKAEKLDIAKKEIDIMTQNGIDAVIVENYFGSPADMETVLDYLVTERSRICFGVNVLDDDRAGFALARRYQARFIQLDSVAGHLPPKDDEHFHMFISQERERTPSFLLGGVRFKYQPYLSGRTLKEDLQIAMTRCDAIVVTGDKTGEATDTGKIKQFRSILGMGFPLIIGAGLTAENGREQLYLADGGIIGSYLKDTYKDSGRVCSEHTAAFMQEVNKIR